MKTLFILRHAKSSWSDATLADFDRPLNTRGERSAPFMGELIGRNAFDPSIILSSPAARARQTAVLAKEAGKIAGDIVFDDRIYEASPQTLGDVVSEIDAAHNSAMLVGHNPGMEGLIRFLTGETEPMPTAALAVIDLEIDDWASIAAAAGRLRAVYRPKDEMDSARRFDRDPS